MHRATPSSSASCAPSSRRTSGRTSRESSPTCAGRTTGRATAPGSADWARTAGSASAGRRSTAARDARRSSSSSSSTSRCAPARRSRCSRSTPSARRSWRYGTDEQKAYYLPGHPPPARSTSRSGTPSRTPAPTSRRCAPRAVRDGDEYVINGQKIFTAGGRHADYCWLAVRTDPRRGKHKGISMIIVPPTRPGSHVDADHATIGASTPTSRTTRTCACPSTPRRRENQGWKLITNQLNHERVAMAGFGGLATRLQADVSPGPARPNAAAAG